MAGDSLEHGDDQKEGGGMKIESIYKVVLHDFYHINAAQDWTNKTDFIFRFEFQIGIEFFGLKPKISIISLIWKEHMLKYSHFDLCKNN